MTSSQTSAPPPGWYPDPGGPGLRWWHGSGWGEQAMLPPGPRLPDRPLADPVTRLLARIIDGVLQLAVILPLIAGLAFLLLRPLFATGQMSGQRAEEMLATRIPLLLLAWLFLALALPFAYEMLMLRRDGQTIGKKVMKLRVVRLSDNRPPTGGQAALRTLIYFALSGVYVDVLWCLWDKPWQQCLHDKGVATIVVPADGRSKGG